MENILIVGDLSGIQDYLFAIAHQHGRQSRRLRARSFFLQALTEAAILRLSRFAPTASVVWCAAGRFLLAADAPPDTDAFAAEYRAICNWLRRNSGSALRFSTVIVSGKGTPAEQTRRVHDALLREKSVPWHRICVSAAGWNTDILALPPISPPCKICKQAVAVRTDSDVVAACTRCLRDEKLGKILPSIAWMAAHSEAITGSVDILGVPFTLHEQFPSRTSTQIALFALRDPAEPADSAVPVVRRYLAQHIPSDQGTTLDFDAIARQARGAPYLGILKMDADSLGSTFSERLEAAADWTTYQRLSERLDRFFAVRLSEETKRQPWQSLYIVFAGGDDLLIVGPWDTVFDFAGFVRDAFHAEFGRDGLTISAGIAITPAKFPIRRGALEAEEALEAAKQGSKNQCAAFGQVWKWDDHATISHWAKCLAQWVESDVAQRGWLQTLLRLIEQRSKEPAAEARVAYHIARNYPKLDSPGAQQRALRKWADQVAREFQSQTSTKARYLSTIVQYALTATRSEAKGDRYE